MEQVEAAPSRQASVKVALAWIMVGLMKEGWLAVAGFSG
jgi:hypothetical protein